MDTRDYIIKLYSRTESEIEVEVGAVLNGFSSFEEACELTDEEMSILWDSKENTFSNRDLLGFSKKDLSRILEKIGSTIIKCREKTRSLIKNKNIEIYNIICIDFELCKKLDSYEDEIDIIVLIAGLLETLLGSLPASGIATYLVKKGIKKYCNC